MPHAGVDIGVDIGKNGGHTTLPDQEDNVLAKVEVANNPKGWGQLGRHLRPGDAVIVGLGTEFKVTP